MTDIFAVRVTTQQYTTTRGAVNEGPTAIELDRLEQRLADDPHLRVRRAGPNVYVLWDPPRAGEK